MALYGLERGMTWIYPPTQHASHHPFVSNIFVFRNPGLNLHLPLLSWGPLDPKNPWKYEGVKPQKIWVLLLLSKMKETWVPMMGGLRSKVITSAGPCVPRPVAWAPLAPPPLAPASVAAFTSGPPSGLGAVGWYRGPLRKLQDALKTNMGYQKFGIVWKSWSPFQYGHFF